MKKVKRHLILLKHFKQKKPYSCGPACLRMLLERLGYNYTEKFLIKISDCNKEGTTNLELKKALKCIGFGSKIYYKMPFNTLIKYLNRNIPLLACFNDHCQIIVGYNEKYMYITDPIYCKLIKKIRKNKFMKLWRETNNFIFEIKEK